MVILIIMDKISLHSSLPFYLNSAMIVFFVCATEFYHRPYLYFVLLYGLIPIIDTCLGENSRNPTPEEEKLLSSQLKWKIPIYAYVIAEWASLFWSFSYLTRHEVSLSDYVIIVLAIGHFSGMGFLFSHELVHKRDLLGQVVGSLSLMKSFYLHFYSDHLLGHHKTVSTPEDPNTAKYNQTLYAFIFQSVTGSFVNSWHREKVRAVTRKHSAYGFGNRMLQWLSLEAGFTVAIFVIFGRRALGAFIVQAVIAVVVLEMTNYIRHYGLLRKKLPNGEYEPVTPKHSWNAPQALQNMLLLNLPKHSDHHANSYKPYQILYSYPEAPNLPCGYGVCLIVAWVPFFWFRIVNPLADATNQSGKPSDKQMSESTKSLRLWMLLQIPTVFGLSFIFN
jgi:alkane 1-monooxygenase